MPDVHCRKQVEQSSRSTPPRACITTTTLPRRATPPMSLCPFWSGFWILVAELRLVEIRGGEFRGLRGNASGSGAVDGEAVLGKEPVGPGVRELAACDRCDVVGFGGGL